MTGVSPAHRGRRRRAAARGGTLTPIDGAVTIPRPALHATLMSARLGSVVALIARAGYGKSRAVDEWLARADLRSARLVLGPQHNAPDALGRAIVAALAEILPLPVDLAPQPGDSVDWHLVLLPRLLDVIGNTPVLLVIEDVHELTDPAASALVAHLVRNTPRRMVLAVVGRRRHEGLGLARAHAEGRLLALGGSALALRRSEFGSLRRLGLGESAIGAVASLVQGWPAAIPLSLAEEGEAEGAARRALEDYLAEELWPMLDPRLLPFLADAAVLSPATAETLDAVRGRADSGLLIRLAVGSDVPLVRLADDGLFHVADLHAAPLRSRLHAIDPDRERTLLMRASAYLARVGQQEVAFDLTRRLGRDASVAFASSVGSRLVLEGRGALVRSWLATIGDDVSREPRLLALEAIADLAEGNLEVAAHKLAQLPGMGAGMAAAESDLSGLASFGADLLEATEKDWLASLRTGWARVLGEALQATSMLDVGDFAEVELRLDALAEVTRALPVVDAWRASVLAYAVQARGDLAGAQAAVDHAIGVADRYALHGHPLAVLWQAVASLIAARQGRRSEALRTWEAARAAWADLARVVPVRARLPQIVLAQAALLLGRPGLAADVLEGLPGHAYPGRPDSFLRVEHDRLAALAAAAVSREPAPEGLTPSRLRILRALASHKTVPAIAEDLGRSPATVRVHVRALYAALDVHNRAEAVARARELGLLPPS